ncbi:MAG: DUF5107 domain-containing protein [Bacteroidaceae bacterium]|nr:DUF5107 domain-containing protein [Bacteroidaceae bacterium]
MVKAWREDIVIPTYEVGKEEKNPVFAERRVYQGSSGVVYPYPVIESVAEEKTDHTYHAVWLENEYIRVMILPELGGRVQMAYDKIAGRHFIYYNQVIKPALVGLAGPWISGGIEFNWPQHHRPSTFMEVDSSIEENSDGSVTVWCSERERMFHQKSMAGFTLHPGCAYLEIRSKLYNPTEVPQTFLWWANPAVHVGDHYQSVFPPDVNAVFDHGKRAVSTFPIATGTYYKVDYSAGVDISNYRNLPVPTSYMVAHSDYDFEGGYENDTHCGMLHVANHHVSPGKKQWTWGNGDFGHAWDRNLTDEDGPYIELMAGVFTENQPDFSWLMPYEEKTFVQYFFPYRELGIVKNASRDFVLNLLPCDGGRARLLVFATSRQQCSVVLRTRDGKVLYSEDCVLTPEAVFDRTIDTGGVPFEQLEMLAGRLVARAAEPDNGAVPAPAEPALKPDEIATCEQLYLTGLHLEQYRHATWCPLDYYLEALRRDPMDVRNNNAVGLWHLRRGRFALAEPYLRTAVRVLQKHNLNPYDGEPLYNLALCLLWQWREQQGTKRELKTTTPLLNEAYDWFYKATWNAACQDAAFFACAQISLLQGRIEDALDEVDHSLARNAANHKGRALRTAILRLQGRTDEALLTAAEALRLDRFNFGCRLERVLMGQEKAEDLVTLMRNDAHNYNELLGDCLAAGLHDEADLVLHLASECGAADIMTFYLAGEPAAAAAADNTCIFPNSLEALVALKAAPADDAKALFLLGNLWYDKRQYDEAMECWERSAKLCPTLPTVWRNLALGYYNKRGETERAVACMEKAFALDTTDARILMELDALYKKLGRPHAERLALLQQHASLVMQRDDLVLEEITLLNLTGAHAEASALLGSRHFHPWEGGEGKVTAQYQFARIALAQEALTQGNADRAIALLEQCFVYPEYLGEGRLISAQEQDIHYFLGQAYALKGDLNEARRCWETAAKGDLEPTDALYYNDAKPEKIFYQGLALRALGREMEARDKFSKLADYGRDNLERHVVMDYFAVSMPDLLVWDEDLDIRNRIHCLFMLTLGLWGLGEHDKARRYFAQAKALCPSHLGLASVEKTIME